MKKIDIHFLSEFIKNYVKSAKKEGCIVDLNGSINSIVIAYLCKKAFPNNTYLIHMHDDGAQTFSVFDIIKKFNWELNTIDIKQIEFDKKQIEEVRAITTTSITKLNRAAKHFHDRLKMAHLYFWAEMKNYLVIGQEDRTECYIGSNTKFGGNFTDLNPLWEYYKTEIYELGKILGLPESILDKPTFFQNDEGIFSHIEIDSSIKALEITSELFKLNHKFRNKSSEQKKKQAELLNQVYTMHSKTMHKRELPKSYLGE